MLKSCTDRAPHPNFLPAPKGPLMITNKNRSVAAIAVVLVFQGSLAAGNFRPHRNENSEVFICQL